MKCIFLLFALLGWAAPAAALDAALRLDAYHHDVWSGKHGAPREIDAMAQTPDGWLWLGTTSGLYRFDGVKFEAFVPHAGESLLGRSITALVARPDGELWIGYTFGGLSVLRDGRLHHVAPKRGDPVGATFSIAFERDGSAWVASTTGLLHYRDGGWTRADAAWNYPGKRAEYVYRDHYDRLWASDGKLLHLLDRARRRFEPVMEVGDNPLLLPSPDGRIWVSDGEMVRSLPAPAGGLRPPPPSSVHASSFQSLFDRDGNYWKGNCPVGLCRAYPATWQAGKGAFHHRTSDERLDQPWQMASLNVHSMMEDREGNLWVGTVAGLERFRHNKLVKVGFPADAERLSLAQDASGATWATTQSGGDAGHLWRIRDGLAVRETTSQTTYIVNRARDGSVLVGGKRRIERRLGERLLATYPLPPVQDGENPRNFVMFAVEDRDSIWVGIGGRGVYRWHDGKWLPPASHPQLRGLLFAAVDAQGRTWFGLRNNRVLMRDGERWREFGEREGVALSSVLFIDAGKEVLIGGDNGLAVLEGERFRPVPAEQPDLLSNVSGVAVTPDGDRWLNTSRGLLHVRAADWRRSMLDAQAPLRAALWDDVDGYPGGAETIARLPSAFAAHDGKVWVAGTAGAAWFDPARLRRNALAPPVQVQALTVGGRPYRPGEVAAFAPGTDQLQVDYTALSYTMPERVRFRYRLVGLDHGWQEVGARRVAYYTNLGPGSYRFEVGAINEDGVASPVVATPAFEIRPRFYQSRWFAALGVLLASLVIYLLYLLRLAQVTRQFHARLEERLLERERIARTLHDTFLQSLQGLILRLQGVAIRLAPGSEARTQLDNALDLADKVVAEGRDQVMDLRLVEAPSLDQALEEAAQLLRAGDQVQVHIHTAGQPLRLSPELHYEVYNIGREALANAFRHARASRIDIELVWEPRVLRIAVRDDGVGLDETILAHGRPGHWGLTGMRERAARIGAVLVIRNRSGGGAEVQLSLPRRLLAAGRRAPAPGRKAELSEV
ncbi:sensor histidine kinase [Massilia niastensis]|uniref:sensor histidine kinase n=1 Tax=Massilia niastensis TaxID=544911 RepID=UPI000360438D|nr:sensor histidine kinase [Massilia niastensis]